MRAVDARESRTRETLSAMYKIQISKIQTPPNGTDVCAPKEEPIFTQQVEELNIQKFIRDLNATPRRRKAKSASNA
jgi:hypothetical protein